MSPGTEHSVLVAIQINVWIQVFLKGFISTLTNNLELLDLGRSLHSSGALVYLSISSCIELFIILTWQHLIFSSTIYGHLTHNKKQFVGSLIKILCILSRKVSQTVMPQSY